MANEVEFSATAGTPEVNVQLHSDPPIAIVVSECIIVQNWTGEAPGGENPPPQTFTILGAGDVDATTLANDYVMVWNAALSKFVFQPKPTGSGTGTVQSASVNGGTPVLPDQDGNVNLIIPIGDGGEGLAIQAVTAQTSHDALFQGEIIINGQLYAIPLKLLGPVPGGGSQTPGFSGSIQSSGYIGDTIIGTYS